MIGGHESCHIHGRAELLLFMQLLTLLKYLQVTEILKYFSWAEPQIKAVKALQHVSVSCFNVFMAYIYFTKVYATSTILVIGSEIT